MNVIALTGNLCGDPAPRRTPQGKTVVNLRLALNDGKKAVYVDVTVWERQAELCHQYLRKGAKVGITGRLDMDEWDDRETGKKRQKLTIVAHHVDFLDRPATYDNAEVEP